MPIFKTSITGEQLNDLINELAFPEHPQVVNIKAGELSAAFELKFPQYSLVLRVNKYGSLGFWKDLYAYKNFTKYGLKIPEIIKNGKFGKFFYSLSRKCPGRTIDTFQLAEGKIIQEDLFKQLYLLYAIPPMGQGYGVWDRKLQARYKDCASSLRYDVGDRDSKKIAKPFTKLDIQKKLQEQALALSGFLTRDRYLYYSDPGYNNACGYGRQITGLFDWADSGYGDFLVDIAWLMFWGKNNLDTKKSFLEFCKKADKKGILNLEHLDQRIKCHLLNIGFGSLNFFTRSDQEKPYNYTIEVLQFFGIL